MSDDDVDALAVLAVLGDPVGDRFVEAPTTQAAMTQLVRQARSSGELFYCATQLGGCGKQVTVVNGARRRPHFRHWPGQHCPLTPAVARDTYTHRSIQNALVSWLHGLGYSHARSEKRVGPHSRVDVHCEPDAVIEVQLSAETDLSMQERTDRYGGNVTWLFHPDRSISSRDSVLDRDGLVMLVQLRGAATGAAGQSRPVDIGIRTETVGWPAETVWVPLEDCTFTPAGGIAHPARQDAASKVATARENQRRAAAAAEEREAARREEFDRMAQQRSLMKQRDRAATPQISEPGDPQPGGHRPPVRSGPAVRQGLYPVVWSLIDLDEWAERHQTPKPVDGAWTRVLRHHNDLFPDWASRLDDRWAVGLPEHLIDPAWATLYLLGTSLSGQEYVFVDADTDPDRVILTHLQHKGLISISGQAPDPQMVHAELRINP